MPVHNQEMEDGIDQGCRAHYSPNDQQERCIFAQYGAQHVTTPLFALQSVFDAWSLQFILGRDEGGKYVNDSQVIPARLLTAMVVLLFNKNALTGPAQHNDIYPIKTMDGFVAFRQVNEWGRNATAWVQHMLSVDSPGLQGQETGGHAAFLSSCSYHCNKWGEFQIDGETVGTAHQTWYNEDYENTRVLWDQRMRYPCPTCCKLDSELHAKGTADIKTIWSTIRDLQGTVGANAATLAARGPQRGDDATRDSGVSLMSCVMIAVLVSMISSCLLLTAISKRQPKLGAEFVPTMQ